MSFKGWWGEQKVKWTLRLTLGFGYKVLHDVLIAFKKGGSTQIDHIVFSRYGIFVIETKNYTGLIHVNPSAKNWIQQLGRQEFKFYNPLKQNITHINTLKRIVWLSNDYFENIVCFVGDSEFADAQLAYSNQVVHLGDLRSVIKSYRQKILTRQQVNNAVQAVKDQRMANTWWNKRKHIKYVQSRQKSE